MIIAFLQICIRLIIHHILPQSFRLNLTIFNLIHQFPIKFVTMDSTRYLRIVLSLFLAIDDHFNKNYNTLYIIGTMDIEMIVRRKQNIMIL